MYIYIISITHPDPCVQCERPRSDPSSALGIQTSGDSGSEYGFLFLGRGGGFNIQGRGLFSRVSVATAGFQGHNAGMCKFLILEGNFRHAGSGVVAESLRSAPASSSLTLASTLPFPPLLMSPFSTPRSSRLHFRLLLTTALSIERIVYTPAALLCKASLKFHSCYSQLLHVSLGRLLLFVGFWAPRAPASSAPRKSA